MGSLLSRRQHVSLSSSAVDDVNEAIKLRKKIKSILARQSFLPRSMEEWASWLTANLGSLDFAIALALTDRMGGKIWREWLREIQLDISKSRQNAVGLTLVRPPES